MKSIILVACALVAFAAAAPTESENVEVLQSDFTQQPDGSYKLDLSLSNGVQREEVGLLEEVLNEEGKPVKVLTVRGSYIYPKPDGDFEKIVYSADQNGFHPEGPSIPQTP